MNYEKINAAARELQELVAQAIKEEMPEQSEIVSGLFYVGDLHVFEYGDIIIPSTDELRKQTSRLELAIAERKLNTAKAEYDECVERLNNRKQ